MANRAQAIEGLRRWTEWIQGLRLAIDEAQEAERFLAESESRRTILAVEVGTLETQKAQVDAQVEAHRQERVTQLERELAAARRTTDQALAAIREDTARERKQQTGERERLEAILGRLEAELGDAQRTHAEGLATLRREREELATQLSVQIADLERRRDDLITDLGRLRKEHADIHERIAAIARR